MTQKNQLNFLLLVIIIFVAACIETDIYLPAFPDMMRYFATSEGAIQNLLTWNFIGICVSGPLYGPLSDTFGRKKPLMTALCLFLAGSIITLFASSLDQMLWGRILQGFGSGGCFVLGTAIIFDAFQKEQAIRATNNLNTIIPLVMAAAPMLGGYLNHTFGFRSNFLVIALFVLVSLGICLFFYKETLPIEKRSPFRMATIGQDFCQVGFNLKFWQLTIVMSLLFGGYITFLSGTSVLFVVEFGMSPALFPFIQAAILGGWVAGSLTLNKALQGWGVTRIKKAGTWLCLTGGSVLALITLTLPQNAYLLTLGMMLYAFGANWMIGLYFPEAMELFPNNKGIAASLMTSARLLMAALIVGLASSLYNGTVYPLSIIVCMTIIIILPLLIHYEQQVSTEV